jgi:glucosylceramidase
MLTPIDFGQLAFLFVLHLRMNRCLKPIMNKIFLSSFLICSCILLLAVPASTVAQAKLWLTKADQSALLMEKTLKTAKDQPQNNFPVVVVDAAKTLQTIDGFGFTLTGGSAALIHQLPLKERSALLKELFGNSPSSIGISCLRISLGASDLSSRVFSYDDLPANATDLALARFSLSDDTLHLIPLLKEILQVQPDLFIMASPWSAPAWMKTNKNSKGGKLDRQYYDVYAKYMFRYIQEMRKQGIEIDALTLQNEPHHGGNNPSMVMQPEDQALLVKQYLGPLFKTHQLSTRIIIWDHNCDEPEYPIAVLNDKEANPFIDGTAFHLYGGDIKALSKVKEAFPDKQLYFTEQWTGSKGEFAGDLLWHVRNVIIGSMNHWSLMALEWNLANDPNFGPHTPGGCTECKGALTIDGNNVKRNVAYYIIAHASKAIPSGSVRIASTAIKEITHVAFKRLDGKIVLIMLNDGKSPQQFNIQLGNQWLEMLMQPGEVATLLL